MVALYTLRDAGEEDGLSFAQILSVTGLPDTHHVADLVQFASRKPKLVEVTGQGTVVITERGVRWVDESPNRP